MNYSELKLENQFRICFAILTIISSQVWSQETESTRTNQSKWLVLPGLNFTYPQIISIPVSVFILNGGSNALTPVFQVEPGLRGNKIKFGLGGNPGFESWSGLFIKASLLNTWPSLGQDMGFFGGGEIQISLLYLHFDIGCYFKTPFYEQSKDILFSGAIGFGI